MSKKQNYMTPMAEAVEVRAEGVIMLSANEVLTVLASSSIDEATSYEDDKPIKW